MTFQYCFDGSIKKVNNLSVSSPRTWGCFHSEYKREIRIAVFPTHVGVFLPEAAGISPRRGLPHARGGVSNLTVFSEKPKKSSPRTWGCFWPRPCPRPCRVVFPTHVGVFPSREVAAMPRTESSPRTWGCFRLPRSVKFPKRVFPTHVGVFPRRLPGATGGKPVFPTHVGVFPVRRPYGTARQGLPHARGGVSGRLR